VTAGGTWTGGSRTTATSQEVGETSRLTESGVAPPSGGANANLEERHEDNLRALTVTTAQGAGWVRRGGCRVR